MLRYKVCYETKFYVTRQSLTLPNCQSFILCDIFLYSVIVFTLDHMLFVDFLLLSSPTNSGVATKRSSIRATKNTRKSTNEFQTR